MGDVKSLEDEVTLKENEIHECDYKNFDAVILSPALGCPAIVKKSKDGEDVILEMLLLTWSDEKGDQGALTEADVAFHLRYCPWNVKTKTNAYYRRMKLYENIVLKTSPPEPIEALIKISEKYDNVSDSFGNDDDCDDGFTLKLAHTNVFEKVLKIYSVFPYLYKVSVNLKYEEIAAGCLYNFRWIDRQSYESGKGKPVWWCSDSFVQSILSGKYNQQLKDYGDNINEKSDENVKVYIYHPVYISNKELLDVGHVTDIHMDSRMDIYAQSEASVIEVKCNCSPKDNGRERTIEDDRFHIPIKDKICNFNQVFTDVCTELFHNGADVLVLTGDLVDYNRGIHTEQTHKKKYVPISKVWNALESDVTKDEYYRTDRNWITFYDRLIDLYDKEEKPVVTILGNHDYVNYGMAPWPTTLVGLVQPWNGVFDQNLTLYESALCYGPGYKDFKAFRKDLDERFKYVEWYMFFINPLADFVLQYGEQSMFMVDWGEKSSVIPPSAKTKMFPLLTFNTYEGVGSLHHAKNVFSKKKKNYAIYKAWIKTPPSIKMLFMHATAICPRDDVSIGEIDYDLSWNDNPLQYGSFDGEREKVLNDLESGKLSIVVGGHSHRNVIMKVADGRAQVIGSGDNFGTLTTKHKKIAMVTSSCGPLPKYIPGGPLVCGCTGNKSRYGTGWDYRDGKLYEYRNLDKDGNVSHLTTRHEVEGDACPHCRMPAKKMVRKHPRRHRPGGNLMTFVKKDENVNVTSVFSSLPTTEPRPGVMCDEQKVFTGLMVLEQIENELDYKKWKKKVPITIVSRTKFRRYGDMKFPDQVQYVTYLKNDLGAFSSVGVVNDNKNRVQISQMIMKESFDGLMKAAKRNNDFAFTRYSFNSTKYSRWDREIKMYKEMKVLKISKESDDMSRKRKDPFKGLVIKFLRKPDLKKRMKLCGY